MSPERKAFGIAATAFILLLLGIRIESRLPDRQRNGEAIAAVHGLVVYRSEIKPAEVPTRSPWPELIAGFGTVLGGAALAGLLAWVAFRMQPFPRRPQPQTSASDQNNGS